MTTPTLAMGISAAGAQTVADLAAAVGALKNNLAQLAAVSGGSTLNNLDALSKEFREMRQEVVQTLQGVRTDLAATMKQAFDGAARQARAGGEQVEKEVKAAAAKVRVAAKSIDLGEGLSASVSGSGLSTKAAVEKMAAELHKLPAAVKAAADRTMQEQLAFEAKQKASWLDHLAALKARMDAEKNMMAQAVAQFREIKRTELTAQIEAENAQKARWVAHQAELAKRLAAEKTMMDAAVRQFRQNQAEMAAASIRGQVGQAMSSGAVVGPYSSITPGSYGAIKGLPVEADRAKAALKGLTGQLNDAHSAARGLASGFGAMWLTWGNVAPLLAGAALSHTFVQTIKMGSEVQHMMEIIRVLSQETAGAVGGLNAQLLEMARTGPFGPQEIAIAMKTLSLAGLDAGQVSSSIKDVLNFAVAGTTSIEKAADVMTSVATAFRISADSYNYVGDVIAKTAAISKSSVESIGEAFKTASVVHAQYGASLEDVGVGLALLSNLGIQGTAAGTALRNMYVDILGRTPKVQAALKQLGVDAFDPLTGKARDLVGIFRDLDKGLSKFDLKSQTKLIQDVFSERGGKEAIAVLDAFRTKYKQIGSEFPNELERLRAQIEKSAGFMAVSAAQLAMTPLNQMKSVVASLQATLVESFDALQPQILTISAQLRNAFQSEEFKNAIQNLGLMVGNLTVFLVKHSDTLVTLASIYAGFKIVGAISAMYEVLKTRVVSATVALMSETAATELATAAKVRLAAANSSVATAGAAAAVSSTTLAAGAGTVLSLVGRLLPWVSGLALAWQMYSMWTDSAANANQRFSDNSDSLLSALQAEAQRLKEVNDAKSLGISLDEMRARKTASQARDELDKPVMSAQAEVQRLQGLVAQRPGPNATWAEKQAYAANQQQLAAAQSRLSDARQYRHDRGLQVQSAEADVAREAQRQRDMVAAEAKARNQQLQAASGTQAAAASGRGAGGSFKALYDNEMSTLNSKLQTRLSALKAAYDNEMGLLDLRHRNELVSEGEFQATVLQRTASFEKEHRRLIETEMVEMQAAYEQRKAVLAKNLKGDQLEQALKNLENDYQRFVESANGSLSKLNTDAISRQQRALISLQGETQKITKTNEDYWKKAASEQAKAAGVAGARQSTAFMSEEERASAEASARVTEQHALHIQKLHEEYQLAQQALADFTSTMGGNIGETVESSDKFNSLTDQVKTLAAAIGVSQEKLEQLKASAAATAAQEVQNRKVAEMAKNLGDAITDAILDGGKDGGQKLKDWLKSYFIREPLRVMVQAFVQPIMQQMLGGGSGGALSGLLGGGQGGGPLGMLSNVGGLLNGNGGMMGGIASSILGSAGAYATAVPGLTMTGVGSQAAMLAAQTSSFGAAGLGATAAAGGGTAIGGALSAIGAAMPYIGAAIAVASMLGIGEGGETRSGATYANGRKLHGPSGGEIGSAGQMTVESIASINQALATLGSSQRIGNFVSGLESSEKGKGFLYAGGRLANGNTFGEFNETIGRSNRRGSYTPEEALKGYAVELQQAFVQAIRAADLPGSIGNLLRRDLTVTYDRLFKIIQEREGLKARLEDLTATDVQRLAKARTAELASIDAVNRTLLKQIHAQEDVNKAAEALAEFGSGSRAFMESLRDFIQEITLNNPLLSPQIKTNTAGADFQKDLTLARSGDAAARSRLTGSAQSYLTAALDSASTAAEYGRIHNRVRSQLVDTVSYEDQQLKLMEDQLKSLGMLNTSVTTWAQAWEAYNKAKDNLAKAKAASDAEDKSKVGSYKPQTAPKAEDIPGTKEWWDKHVWGKKNSANTVSRGAQGAVSSEILGSDGDGTGTAGASAGAGVGSSSSSFAVGTNYVPFDMTARIHEGERIVPKWDNPYANPYTPDERPNSGETAYLLRAFAQAQDEANYELVSTLKDIKRIFNNWDANGMPGVDPDWAAT
jgi:TP901 family phage tail tape measure protein